MVDGFKLKITSDELTKHCNERAAYHRDRADAKEAEIPKFEKAAAAYAKLRQPVKAAAVSGKMGAAMYNDESPQSIVDTLRDEVHKHRNQALVFDFFAGHLFDEDYTLQESDLRRLEIIR